MEKKKNCRVAWRFEQRRFNHHHLSLQTSKCRLSFSQFTTQFNDGPLKFTPAVVMCESLRGVRPDLGFKLWSYCLTRDWPKPRSGFCFLHFFFSLRHFRNSNLRGEQEHGEIKKIKNHDRKGQRLRESTENLPSRRQRDALKKEEKTKEKTQECITAVEKKKKQKLPACEILNTMETLAAHTVCAAGDAKCYFFI